MPDLPIHTLFLDCETLPLLVYAWEVGNNQSVNYNQIRKEREVACISYAFDDEKPQSLSLDLGKYNVNARDDDADKKMLQKISQVISKATIVSGHNAKSFDIAVLRSRLVKHKLPDFAPLILDDTYLQSKEIAFTSRKLDYLSQYLLGEEKEAHEFGLWIGVVNKDKTALAKMVKYCEKDVILLRKVYNRLAPYSRSMLNRAVFSQNRNACPHCGVEGQLIIRKYRYTLAGKYPTYQCKSCGHYFTIGKSEIKNSKEYPRSFS